MTDTTRDLSPDPVPGMAQGAGRLIGPSGEAPVPVPSTPVDQSQDHALFEGSLRRRNHGALLTLLLLGTGTGPLLMVLDRLIAPAARHALAIPMTLALVIGGGSFVGFLLAVRFRHLVQEHVVAISAAVALADTVLAATLCWAHGGYASPYSAAVSVVVITAGSLFLWPVWLAGCVYLVGYLAFLAPLIAGWLPVGNLSVAITYQGALVAIIVVTLASQVHRYRLVSKEFFSSLALQRTRSSLEDAYLQLKGLDRLKRDFFNNITHELRTPLSMILAPLESLIDGDMGELEPAQASYLQAIWKNGLRLLRIVNDLLDLARIEERRLDLDRVVVDLDPLVTDLVAYARPLAERKGVELLASVPPTGLRVSGDREKLERVLVNLAANALKFTPPGGRIEVSLAAVGEDDALLEVSDTGIGIPADRLPLIFDRFGQADSSVQRRFGGSGIGLAYAREIVELHRGRITVRSEPGGGSTFTVTLPRLTAAGELPDGTRPEIPGEASPPAAGGERDWARQLLDHEAFRFLELEDSAGPEQDAPGPRVPRSTRVLLVEDDPGILRFVTGLIRQEHEVVVACNGREGLDRVQERVPDLIVTDYMMPVVDGLAMVERLRRDERTADVPIIMLTARTQLEDRLEARQKGADVYLSKPFSPRELRAAIRQLLERRGRHVGALMRTQVRSLATISGGLAHEMQNPLSYIKNAFFLIGESVQKIDDLVGNTGDESERNRKLRTIRSRVSRLYETAERGIARIEKMVQLLRHYSREGYPREPSDIVFDDAVRTVVDLSAPREGTLHTLDLQLDSGGARVRCIPEEMQQAIGNLVQNAVDVVAPGGTIRVRTSVQNASVVLEVNDDGPGISPEIMGRIFTPFFTTKEPGQGMGVGLAIAHQVIQESGGSIEVTSTPGHGATFRVRLRLSPLRWGDPPPAGEALPGGSQEPVGPPGS